MKMEQRLVATTKQAQVQKQILSPRIIQSVEILAMTSADLDARVQEELAENPTLTLENPEFPDEYQHDADSRVDPAGQSDSVESDRIERDIEFLEHFGHNFSDDWQPSQSSSDDGEDAKQAALNNATTTGETLQDSLLQQLAMFELNQEVRDACERIIESLDERGYLPIPLEDVVHTMGLQGSLEIGRAALNIVQNLDPRGVGARNTAEALLLQIDLSDIDYPLFRSILEDHWEDFIRNRLRNIELKTHYTMEDITFAIDHLKTLDPFPGYVFNSTRTETIEPDARIEEDPANPGEYRVHVFNERVPRISVSRKYLQMYEETTDPETRKFLRNKIENARTLIEAIQQRQSTLRRVTEVILERQRDALETGLSALKALRMQDVAELVGVHVSTISRAVSNKYVETPQGILPYKAFFVSNTTQTDDGDEMAAAMIREELRKIVDEEDPSKPLSDQVLCKLLNSTLGIEIARRTVAKYRDQLSIPDSRKRRKFA